MTTPYYNNHTHQITFLFVPKTGCTTITNVLKESESTRSNECMYKSFAILRDPKDRILSGYHEALRRGTHQGSLLDLMKRVKQEGFFETHIVPQTHYFYPVDRIFIFPDFKSVSQWIGVDLPHLNRTEKKQDEWTPESSALFTELYAEDIDFWQAIQSKMR